MGRNAVTYEGDYVAWTLEQARLLRSGAFSEVDAANIAEELDDMGRSVRRELRSRFSVLIMHLLKWRYQAGFRSRSWSSTIEEQRQQVRELLDESPSLRAIVTREMSRAYEAGRKKAAAETGFPESTFPAKCPFTADQILAEDFLPEG
jgi:uncharacterized protein DUF29